MAGLQRHVTAAILVIKNKGDSLLWKQKSIFMKNLCEKKTFYCIDHQHGHLVTWLQTKNSWWLLGHLFHILMVDKFMWHNFIIHIAVFSWQCKLIENQWHDTHDAIIIDKLTVFIDQALICWLVFLCNRWRSCFWWFQLDLVAEVSWLTIRLVHR